jgi:4a-hydroxytetrahydrobiopterin dehydratase
MTQDLAQKNCIPCQGGVLSLPDEEIQGYLEELTGWFLNDKEHLEKSYDFKDFRDGFEFVKRVGEMAEVQGHHPDIFLAWGKVVLEIWTHKINGLVESDFIFAAKADELLQV